MILCHLGCCIRLRAPGDEMISPVEFIPLLEKSRLIIPVGEFVLNEAAKMCREMQQYIADFRVNINVSYIQIMRGSMANKILTAVPPGYCLFHAFFSPDKQMVYLQYS